MAGDRAIGRAWSPPGEVAGGIVGRLYALGKRGHARRSTQNCARRIHARRIYHPGPLMTVDFAINGSLVRPGRPRYPVLVHRAAALLHASFRRHLAMTP